MEKIDELKKGLIKDINFMKRGSIGEMLLIIKFSLISYLKCLLVFGHKSIITKDNLNVIKEMFDILKLEKKILKYILKNIKQFNLNATIEVMMMLDELNERTIRYYYDVIDDIETAADMHNVFRALRASNNPPTLIQSYSYVTVVISLAENIESLKLFLGFEEEFWNYIQNKVEIIEFDFTYSCEFPDVEPIIKDDIVVDIKIKVPKVINLQSALIAIREYKKAYELYTMIGCKYDKNKIVDDEALQKKYCEEYLLKKAKNQFKLKNVM